MKQSKELKLSQEMIANIRGYGATIKTFENLVGIFRHTPSRFIGGIGNKGFKNMFREIFQNGVDEMMRKNSPCTHLKVTFDERTLTSIVEDNGRGIPFEKMITIFTDDKTSTNYNKQDGDYSSGTHGTGSTITNALCESFIIESYILGEARKIEFKDFIPTTEEPVKIENPGLQGTRVIFTPSLEVMGNITVDHKDILKLMRSLMPLTEIGHYVEFKYIDKNGKIGKETILNRDGVLSILINNTEKPLVAPVTIKTDTGKIKTDIIFTYDIDENAGESIIAYSNMCYNIYGGTHVDGFTEGIVKYFRNYMNKIYLKKNSKLSITKTDIIAGLKAVVNISVLHPQFLGQAKDSLGNAELVEYLRDLTYDTLESWSKKNPNDLQKVAKYLKGMAEIRTKAEASKVKMNKYQSSAITGLPSKYDAPDMSLDNLEFIMFEGDSAAGKARTNKLKNQGLLPLRGKLTNAFTTTRAKLLSNSEIQSIITILNSGYGKSFDISKCKYEKIIIMCDADPDGAHIATLLLSFFLLYMPDLIKHGRLYKAVPPLYGVPKGKKKMQYFTNKYEYISYLQKSFSKDNEIVSLKTKDVLKPNQVFDLLYRNSEYISKLESIASRYALDPHLLELVLVNRHLSTSKLSKTVNSVYRFVEARQEKNMVVVEGLIGEKYQYLFLNDMLLRDVSEIVDYIDNINMGDMYYTINGVTHSLHSLMTEFEKTTPNGLKRFKGLGEMNGDQLMESTLSPNGNRTLIRYTLDNAKEEIEAVRYMQSNKSKLIKEIGQVSKTDLI